MQGKDYLERCKELVTDYELKKEKYLTLKYEYESIGFGCTGVDAVQCSSDPDKFTNKLVNMLQAEKELKLAEKKLAEYKEIALSRIVKLEKINHQKILYYKYFEFKSFNQIAKILKNTRQWVMQLHNKALYEFDKMYYGFF